MILWVVSNGVLQSKNRQKNQKPPQKTKKNRPEENSFSSGRLSDCTQAEAYAHICIAQTKTQFILQRFQFLARH
jgi:hypothetical protein